MHTFLDHYEELGAYKLTKPRNTTLHPYICSKSKKSMRMNDSARMTLLSKKARGIKRSDSYHYSGPEVLEGAKFESKVHQTCQNSTFLWFRFNQTSWSIRSTLFCRAVLIILNYLQDQLRCNIENWRRFCDTRRRCNLSDQGHSTPVCG